MHTNVVMGGVPGAVTRGVSMLGGVVRAVTVDGLKGMVPELSRTRSS